MSHFSESPVNFHKDESLKKDSEIAEVPSSEEGITFEDAERLFGNDFFGPEKIEEIFGSKPESVPNIPFSKEELERAKELGQQLIFCTDVMSGEVGSNVPLTLENLKQKFTKVHYGSDQDWYSNEDFFKKEKPRVGWRLTSKDTLRGSTQGNYLWQTDVLVKHLENEIFKGVELPKLYKDAIDEFKHKRAEIESTVTAGAIETWKHGSQMLADLALTKIARELPVEAMYRFIVNDRSINDKPLLSTETWTASRTADGVFVRVGWFGDEGVFVDWGRAGFENYRQLGVSFSRG